MAEEEPEDNGGKRDVIIVLSGLEGSGKSTLGRKLSEMLGWPLVSTGSFLSAHADDREGKLQAGYHLDQNTSGRWVVEMLSLGHCVVDSARSLEQIKALRADRTVWHVHLICSPETRLRRLADRDGSSGPIPSWSAGYLARCADDCIDTEIFGPAMQVTRIINRIGENSW